MRSALINRHAHHFLRLHACAHTNGKFTVAAMPDTVIHDGINGLFYNNT